MAQLHAKNGQTVHLPVILTQYTKIYGQKSATVMTLLLHSVAMRSQHGSTVVALSLRHHYGMTVNIVLPGIRNQHQASINLIKPRRNFVP